MTVVELDPGSVAAGAALIVALGELSETQRWAFVGRAVHGRSYRELGEARGVSGSAVWAAERAARRNLRRSLAPYREVLERVAA